MRVGGICDTAYAGPMSDFACIDAHHHLWRYSAQEFPWISGTMEILQRDYLLQDLQATAARAGVTGTVAVQARQSTAETEWLLDLADTSDLIRGVVGWAPLVDAGVEEYIAAISQRKKLKGLRHVLHDEADGHYMLREDFNRGISALQKFGLRYDILIFEHHLPQTIRFVDRHPSQIFILDHIAKPRIRESIMQPWESDLRELARRPNVYCKLSGLVTEANCEHWNEADLWPYIETVLSCFGPQRLMFGSDWPVVQLASSYDRWLDTAKQAIAGLTAAEQARILAGTAVEAYAL